MAEGLQETQQLVDQLSKEIRTMSYLLHPPLLDESGLPVALHWYAEGLSERSGLRISVNVPEDLGRFGRDMELTIFRLVQECLTNIHRHSGSKTADITVWADDRELGLEIRDEGRGIPPEGSPPSRRKAEVWAYPACASEFIPFRARWKSSRMVPEHEFLSAFPFLKRWSLPRRARASQSRFPRKGRAP